MLHYQSQLYVFWSTLSAYMHAVALLGTAGVTAGDFLPYAKSLVVDLASDGPMGFLGVLAEAIDAGVHPGESNTLLMQAVGARHVVETARDAGIDTRGPEALKDLFWSAVEAGHGTDGLSSVIEAVRAPARPDA